MNTNEVIRNINQGYNENNPIDFASQAKDMFNQALEFEQRAKEAVTNGDTHLAQRFFEDCRHATDRAAMYEKMAKH